MDSFDEELATMALLRGASDTYQELTTALLAQDTLTKAKVTNAFKNEELLHVAACDSTSSSTSSALKATTPPPPPTSSSPKCDFCGAKGHIQNDCNHFKVAKGKAQEDHLARFKGKKANSNVAKAEDSPTEFAGSASPRSPSSSSPASDAWNADTGATYHMTPHRHWFVSYSP
jgi:Pol polyprotein, beta-barrel domain